MGPDESRCFDTPVLSVLFGLKTREQTSSIPTSVDRRERRGKNNARPYPRFMAAGYDRRAASNGSPARDNTSCLTVMRWPPRRDEHETDCDACRGLSLSVDSSLADLTAMTPPVYRPGPNSSVMNITYVGNVGYESRLKKSPVRIRSGDSGSSRSDQVPVKDDACQY